MPSSINRPSLIVFQFVGTQVAYCLVELDLLQTLVSIIHGGASLPMKKTV